MKKDPNSVETTSRRHFTRAMVTAAVAAPIATSLAGCGKGAGPATNSTSTSPPATPTATTSGGTGVTGDCTAIQKNGYTEITFGPAGAIVEEHIPPMDIGGGGSLVVDSHNKLKTTDTGTGPFTYVEDGVQNDDRYGDIAAATVITETTANPFLSIVMYTGFLPGAQLLLWYQDISPNPEGDNDTGFTTPTFVDNDPDVRFVGGKGTNLFRMVVKRKALEESNSHKPQRPHRYKHTGGAGLARHFRIGRWRLVDRNDAMLVENSGADDYTIYLRYGHYQPPTP